MPPTVRPRVGESVGLELDSRRVHVFADSSGKALGLMSRIQINSVTKRFGEVTALDGIELDIADGEFFCVLGPPGAGKTTLLRTIVGLEHPEAGRILIGGTDVTDLVPSERNVVDRLPEPGPLSRQDGVRQSRLPAAAGKAEGVLV